MSRYPANCSIINWSWIKEYFIIIQAISIKLRCGGICHYLDLPVVTIYPNGTVTIAESNNVTLRCKATGDGTLNYQWNRVSRSLPKNVVITNINGGETLTIHNITVSDSGRYYCEVDNGGDSVSSRRVQVTVKSGSQIVNRIMFNSLHTGKPSVTDSSGDQQLSIISGNEQVTLTCKVTGDNIAGSYWESVNRGSLNRRNNDSSLSNGNTTVQLIITRARPEHSGIYRCVVYSQWGVAQSRIVQVTIASESNNVLM